MHKRINITLPEETVKLLDRLTAKGNRSRFITEAVKRYVEEVGITNLKKQLKEGAIKRAERDLKLADEWFFLEEEICQTKK